jgi:hypothetical protein
MPKFASGNATEARIPTMATTVMSSATVKPLDEFILSRGAAKDLAVESPDASLRSA